MHEEVIFMVRSERFGCDVIGAGYVPKRLDQDGSTNVYWRIDRVHMTDGSKPLHTYIIHGDDAANN